MQGWYISWAEENGRVGLRGGGGGVSLLRVFQVWTRIIICQANCDAMSINWPIGTTLNTKRDWNVSSQQNRVDV